MNYLFVARIALVAGLVFGGTQEGSDNRVFTQFWTKFRDAVLTQDHEAVASMTKVPFVFEGKPRNRRGFVKICDQLFDREIRNCFSTARPRHDGDLYEVVCGRNRFYFSSVEGKYKFLEISADN